jgi:lysophospholipase L1-like esterase
MRRRQFVGGLVGASGLVAGHMAMAQAVGTAPILFGGGQAAPVPRVPPLDPSALPLPNRTKIAGLGHSFIQRGYRANFSGSTISGTEERARGVLPVIAALDGRFNLDIFAMPDAPFGQDKPSLFNATGGANHGIGGEHLLATSSVPGSINRTPYVLNRGPGIVYLDIGTNDINSGVGGAHGTDNSASTIIAALDRQIALLTSHGVWVVLQSVAWRFDWPEGDPRFSTLEAVNAWIRTQAGRPGVKLCDTVAIDGTASADRALFETDGVHPNIRMSALRAEILLPILRSMVTHGDARAALDPLAADNLFIRKGLKGVSGTLGAGASGTVATGMTLTRGRGQSTAVGAKEVLSPENERQIVSVTNKPGDTSDYQYFDFRCTANPSLSSLGLASGDWVQMDVPVEFDEWAGWVGRLYTGEGPAALFNDAYDTGYLWTAENSASVPGRSTWLTTRMEIPAGTTMLRWASRVVRLFFDTGAGGTGTVRIGSPILRKIADPRPAWNLN